MAKKTIKLAKGTVYQKEENGNFYFRYQVNGQRKALCLKTRNQKDAIKAAEEMLPLVSASNTEVVAAHVQHAKGWKRKIDRLALAQMWDVYATHPDRVRPKSQKIWNLYRIYLDEFLTWLKSKYPEIQYMDELRDIDEHGQKMNTSAVSEYAEYLKTRRISVDTHNKKIARPAHIFQTLSKYLVAPSPWDNHKLKRLSKDESHITDHRQPFPPDKEKSIFEAVSPKSSLKILNKEEIEVLCYILRYTGQRQKDGVNLSWNKINLDRNRLWVTQEKTGKDVSIPIAPELHEMLKKAESWKVNDKVLPKTAERYAQKAKDGTDVGVNLINKQLLNVIRHVGLEPSVTVQGRDKKMTIYGAHSFRHGFASYCAEAGVPRAVCASILGADANIIDTYYVHIGEEAQDKAIQAISKKAGGISAQDRIDNALKIIKGIDEKSNAILEIEKALRE